ncbi:MAG TPA: response regulator [Symbiobacteriaceae bacterium]|jgi:DNA-binding response OmpR family regulator|nr:response regulator [Symbiobacteriaceae bacterium]
MRILIAEDEPLISDSLSRLLSYLGHDVTVTPEAAATLEMLHRQSPDLLLLDWLMPEGGGQRVMTALSGGQVPRTKVILMTGSPDEHLPVWLDRLPVLHKPFRLHDLQRVLTAVQTEDGPETKSTAEGLN